MLEPNDRGLLLEALRPPEGYELDRAVGTTFSLDLIALLTAPLAFTLFSLEEHDGRPEADPLALLAAVRQYAERISVFCQAGQIAVPPHDQLLYAHLEDSVFEVTAPHPEGVFHPKVWLLRYRSAGAPVHYRFLCLSRNLTFDRSWDTMLLLDGKLGDRRNAFSQSHPVGDFIAALPGLARREVPAGVKEAVELMQHEVRRVRFEPPEGFESFSFHPLGLDRRPSWPFGGRIDRLLLVSPFLAADTLGRLTKQGEGHVLVSRAEAIDELGEAGTQGFEATKVLAPDAQPGDAEAGAEVAGDPSSRLSGLHAKAYVADAGWKARVWVGSANATKAAFERNVEFLVELEGKKSRCGVGTMIASTSSSQRFDSLLEDYAPPPEPEFDGVLRELEMTADAFARMIAEADLRGRVEADGESSFRLSLSSRRRLSLPESGRLLAWPVTQRKEVAAREPELGRSPVVVFSGLALESVTPFVAFELTVAQPGRKYSRSFVVKVQLAGDPAERREAVLRALLRNRQEVLRYLMFLLHAAGGEGTASSIPISSSWGSASGEGLLPGLFGQELVESLLHALDRDPDRLNQIARLIDDLKAAEAEGQPLLPEGFDRVWDPIWAARRGLGG